MLLTRATVDGLVAATAISVTWLLFAMVLAGAGRLIGRWITSGGQLTIHASTWFGLALFLCYVPAIHLLLPASQVTWAPVVLLSVIEASLSRRQVMTALRRGFQKVRTPLVAYSSATVLILTLWVASLSVQPPFHYDSGLYHLQAISWARDYPLVTGLANVHFRLGFTSAWWPFASSLGWGPWRGHESHLPTGFLVSLLLGTQVMLLARAIQRRRFAADEVLSTLLLPVTASQIAFGWISSPAYDQPAYVLAVMTAIFGVRAITGSVQAVPVALAMAVSTAVVRLQFAPFSILLSLAVLLAWSRRSALAQIRRSSVAFVFVGAFSAAVFVTQGVITSGYPLFPLTAAAAPVPWRIPSEVADSSAADIANWARLAVEGTDGWSWFASWAKSNFDVSPTFTYGIGLLVVSLAASTVAWLMRGERGFNQEFLPLISVGSAAGINVLAWFFTAPDPRYGMGVIWVAAACAAVIATGWLRPRARVLLLGCVFVLLSAQAVHALAGSGQLWPKHAVGTGPFNVVDAPVPPTERLGPNPSYLVPLDSDQCWDAPIPCADTPHPGLRQRGDSPDDGFLTYGSSDGR